MDLTSNKFTFILGTVLLLLLVVPGLMTGVIPGCSRRSEDEAERRVHEFFRAMAEEDYGQALTYVIPQLKPALYSEITTILYGESDFEYGDLTTEIIRSSEELVVIQATYPIHHKTWDGREKSYEFNMSFILIRDDDEWVIANIREIK